MVNNSSVYCNHVIRYEIFHGINHEGVQIPHRVGKQKLHWGYCNIHCRNIYIIWFFASTQGKPNTAESTTHLLCIVLR